jgi:uncharacterized damage-inducible protein DinB
MMKQLQDLLGHMAWADAVALHAWRKSGLTSEEELRRRWDHIATVQEAFLKVLSGEELQWDPAKPVPTFEELAAWIPKNHRGLQHHLAALNETDLGTTIQMPWFDPPCVITVGEAFTQVAMHTQHHRGQVATRLKDKGAAPKDVDFILWIWKGRPQPRWEA